MSSSFEQLNLSSNGFRGFEDEVLRYQQFKEIDISNNEIQIVPEVEVSERISVLKILNLANNRVKKLPSSFSLLKSLRVLDVSSNSQISFPDEIWNLTQIEELYLSQLGLTQLEGGLMRMNSLKVLDLSENQLPDLPSDWQGLEMLQELNLESNRLTTLPLSLNSLVNLQKLSAGFNIFVGDLVVSLPNLQYLSIVGNPFPLLDISAFVNRNLTFLDCSVSLLIPSTLSSSQLKYIGLHFMDSLPSLPSGVSSIILTEVGVREWPESWSTTQFDQLVEFSLLVQNETIDFPLWLANSPNLELLDLVNVQGTVPSFLGDMTQLEFLSIANSPIEGTIPSEFGMLKNLETLRLVQLPNLHGSIPRELVELNETLKVVYLMDTGVDGTLPKEFSFLDEIQVCEFGEQEAQNLKCEPATMVGGYICGLKCDQGLTIEGTWINEGDSCKQVQEGVPLLYWYNTAFTVFPNGTFIYVVTLSFFCTSEQHVELISSFLGSLVIDGEPEEIDPGVFLMNLTITRSKFEVMGLTAAANVAFNLVCGVNVVPHEVADLSELRCVLNPTSMELFPISRCSRLEVPAVFDSNTQSLSGPFREVFLHACSTQPHLPFSDDLMRRWWNCSSTPSVYGLDCLPQCGDKTILQGEQCDDGNSNSGDGCSSKCQLEQDWECSNSSEGSQCLYQCRGDLVASESDCSTNSRKKNNIIAIVVSVVGGLILLAGFFYFRRGEVDTFLIPENELESGEILGEGEFGRVYKGIWRGTTEVAIKDLKLENISDEEVKAFQAEARLLSQLHPHPNIVQFLGLCLIKESGFSKGTKIVTELMIDGSLVDFLRSREKMVLTGIQIQREEYLMILGLAKGIAAGMDHLHKSEVLHRDLAARNVLIQNFGTNVVDLEVFHRVVPKITDFGLSVKDSAKETRIPVRWSAPEVLIDPRNFCKGSDVWSFGVVLFEMITNCSRLPYSGISKIAVVRQEVLRGAQLDPPEGTPVPYLSLMRACFQSLEFRATFASLFEGIVKELPKVSKQSIVGGIVQDGPTNYEKREESGLGNYEGAHMEAEGTDYLRVNYADVSLPKRSKNPDSYE